jgi:hypothetical protein
MPKAANEKAAVQMQYSKVWTVLEAAAAKIEKTSGSRF